MRGAIFIIIGLAVLTLGIWWSTQGVGEVAKAIESHDWPHIEGHVIQSQVEMNSSHGPHGGTSYTPKVSYLYSVGDQHQTGTEIAPGRLWSSRSAYEAVDRFQLGSAVTVYYATAYPADSVLMPGLHFASFGRIVLGLTVTFMGTLFFGVGVWLGFIAPPGVNNFSFPPGSTPIVLFLGVFGTFFALMFALYGLSQMDL